MSSPADSARVRFTIEVVESGEGYRAHEPASDSDVFGRGDSEAEAVENYALAIQAIADGEESTNNTTEQTNQ